jgi:two-component system, NarL family, invasion response regulator UvrY
MRKVLVVDDHPSVRAGVSAILEREIANVQCTMAGSAAEAIQRADESDWDAVVLDMTMPGRSGSETISDLKRLRPHARILVYSVHHESQFGVRTLRAGADGYLTKDRPIAELLEAVRTLLDGRRYISPALADALATAVTAPEPAHLKLSDREMQVYRLLVEGKSPTEIASELSLSIKTVSTYRSRIGEKLNAGSLAEMIRYAYDHGLL